MNQKFNLLNILLFIKTRERFFILSEKIQNQLSLKLNTNANFNWQSEHIFKQIKVTEEIAANVITLQNRPDNQPVPNSLFKRNNDLFYNI